MICPKCGGLALIQEHAENGLDFIGCVMPKCQHEWIEKRPLLTKAQLEVIRDRFKMRTKACDG